MRMSLRPKGLPEVPEQTMMVARAAFPQGSLAMRVRDRLAEVFADEPFADTFGVRGAPGLSPGVLSLVTVLQFAEDLTDRQAAAMAVRAIDWKYALGAELTDTGFDASVLSRFRTRLAGHGMERVVFDWKYALGAELTDTGFDASVLSRFRTRLAGHGMERVVFDRLLEHCKDEGLVAAGGKQRTDSTHVISAVRDLSRLELAGESVRAALEALAVAAPAWLAGQVDVAEFAHRYGPRVDGWRMPSSQTKRDRLAQVFGQDALALCRAAWAPDAPGWIREIDSGYPSADLITAALERGTRMVTPVLRDQSAQARAATGFDKNAFAIDWKARLVRCPAGKSSAHWNPVTQHGADAIVITFSVRACRPCPFQERCTSSALGRRMLTLRPQEAEEALVRARAEQKTETWKATYALRAGVEGTINQALDITGMRRARYRGLPKVRLQHAFSATALNVIRIDAYWNGHDQHHTRSSRLEGLVYRLTAGPTLRSRGTSSSSGVRRDRGGGKDVTERQAQGSQPVQVRSGEMPGSPVADSRRRLRGRGRSGVISVLRGRATDRSAA
jgi:transposase